MLNLAGELVVYNSGLISVTQMLKENYSNTALIQNLEEKIESLVKVARDLQDAVMKVRMLPVASVFNRFIRVVRDLAKDRGKQINFEIYGEDTEIDKKVMDRIGEPLVHLIRNPVDHGIESKQEREHQGKDVIGHLSGRGVGLDVVKKTVDELGGDVRVRSTKGEGTTITIILPLTMAIISAILVEVDGYIYAVPLSSVREVVKMKKKELKTVGKNIVLRLRDEVISIALLKDILEIGKNNGNGFPDEKISIVVVDYVGKKIGPGVEKLLGNEEIVIKSLSKNYQEIEGLSGASILGNGKIALILDVEAMVKKYYSDESQLQKGTVDIKTKEKDKRQIKKYKENIEKDCYKNYFKENFNINPHKNEKELSEKHFFKEQFSSPLEMCENELENKKEVESISIELNRNEKEVLEEIHNNGAVKASISMTQLVGRDIRVSFPDTKIIKLSEVSTELGGDEEPVGGIYIPIHEDLTFGILIVLPMNQVFNFRDMLFQIKSDSNKELTEEETSALLEVGNILSASFINTMANYGHFVIRQDVPQMRIDMCIAVLDSILARFNQPGDTIILIQAELYLSDTEQVLCYMLLFLEPESMIKLGNVLNEIAIRDNINRINNK